MFERIDKELDIFNNLKTYFKEIYPYFKELDQYGFSLNSNNSSELNSVNILLTGLTHGDETIGLQIINLILQEIKTNLNLGKNVNFKIAFLLNNVEAYKKNIRFIESDLNRSFGSEEKNTKEKKRAQEIENIISQFKIELLLDLHQTIEITNSAFVVIPESEDLIQLSNRITKQYPIVTFSPSGFSHKGKTLIEYAKSKSILALVYEIGQKGFNDAQADEFKKLVLSLADLDINQLRSSSNSPIEYYHINNQIPNQNGLKLVDGLSSLQRVLKGQVLAKNGAGYDFICPNDSIMVFPRYKNIEKDDQEIGLLAVKKHLISKS